MRGDTEDQAPKRRRQPEEGHARCGDQKVIKAASRSAGTAIAAFNAPPMAASSARPASAAINAAGNALKIETSVAPKMPSTR